ncbi:MAG: LLM class flavin-dependent oxidoreductase [Ilumatobacteraceae bacterium]
MTSPFDHGSVSLGTYVHDLAPTAMVDTLLAQAVLADESGFDGVTIAEHHAGYPTYMPNPILGASWLLDAMPRAWSGPNPVLLPLRTPGLVLQDLAWLAARHPGRVGATFASGYVEQDFVACNVPFAGRNARFRDALGVIGGELTKPSEVFAGDPVVRAAADAGVPMIVAAKGARAVTRAAELGMGLSVPLTDPAQIADVNDLYLQAGGTGPRLMMRWVWIGDLPEAAIRRWDEEHRYSIDSGAPRQVESSLRVASAADAGDVAALLAAELVASHCTCLSVRIHMPDVPPEQVAEQIAGIGTDVLPRLRSLLAT